MSETMDIGGETEAPAPVRVTGAGRRFGRRWALRGLSLRVAAGEIVGLVGPNGSGKTTLFRLLAGLLRPSEGEVRLFGRDPRSERARVMERVRFAFAPPALFGNLSAREHLRCLARMRTADMPEVSRADLDRTLETVGLASRAADPVRTFSFGMRQRLALAQALVPLPELIVLDEPTDGLDPLAILELREVLKRLRREHGVAILLSSHLLVEVGELVDHLMVLSDGTCLFAGTPAELCADGDGVEIEVGAPEAHANGAGERARSLFAERGVHAERMDEDGRLRVRGDELRLGDAARWLAEGGLELRAFQRATPSLEQALIRRLRASQSSKGEERGERA